MTTKGIDVSGYQCETAPIDFKRVKASGVDFVLVKAGYFTSTVPTFEQNYSGAKAAGLHVGAYWYSCADTVDEAKREAAACIAAIKGKQFDFPIYFDLEERSQLAKGRKFCSEITEAFCGAIQAAGYLAGLYISRDPLQNLIYPETAKKYELWIAEWGSRCRYDGEYGIWQYSDNGRVDGVTGAVDLDYCYKDYPSIIANGGYNGFSTKKTVEQLAREVLNGKWGNGDDRKSRLTAAGYDYYAVQKRVNELVYAPKKTVGDLAAEVIRGNWGNGDDRKKRLTEAGYDYNTVQKRVNELMR